MSSQNHKSQAVSPLQFLDKWAPQIPNRKLRFQLPLGQKSPFSEPLESLKKFIPKRDGNLEKPKNGSIFNYL